MTSPLILPLLLFACWTPSVFAQPVSTPRAAVLIDGRGRLVEVPGISSNLLPVRTFGPVLDSAPVSVAFSAAGGAVKTGASLLILDAAGSLISRRTAPLGPALFSFPATSDGALQWVYFLDAARLENASGSTAFHTLALGNVAALGPSDAFSLLVLVRQADQFWEEVVDLPSGAVHNQVPVVGLPPAVFFADGWLATAPNGFVWQAAGRPGISRTVAFQPEVLSLQVTGSRSVAINAAWLVNPDWKFAQIPVVHVPPATVRSPRPGGPRQ